MNKTDSDAVYSFDGHKYRLRQLGQYVFYQVDGMKSSEQTRFISGVGALGLRHWPPARSEYNNEEAHDNICARIPWYGRYPQANFMAQVRAGESGRYALHTSQVYRNCTVIILLRTDGTGTCLHDRNDLIEDVPGPYPSTEIRWNAQECGLARSADILDAPLASVAAQFENILAEQVYADMKNSFVTYEELPDEPYEYLCGSEADLKRITRCILHSHLKLFNVGKRGRRRSGWQFLHRDLGSVTLRYQAATSQKPGGLLPPHPKKDELQQLLDLAYRYNAFRGGHWERDYNYERRSPSGYKLVPEVREFSAALPSMHEQAEALLTLNDWLDGKVTEEEKRLLLGGLKAPDD